VTRRESGKKGKTLFHDTSKGRTRSVNIYVVDITPRMEGGKKRRKCRKPGDWGPYVSNKRNKEGAGGRK